MKFKRPSTRPLFKNPLAYRDGWKCEWSRGHRLDKIENSGHNVSVTFKYDESGVRTQKTVNGVQNDFITSGIKLLAQKTGENVLLWQVDGNGNTVGFNYNNIPYFYMKNLQGDIIGITDASGNVVTKYTYDSWGKLISIKDANDVDKTTDMEFIGYINPLRYRGYYYDSETALYYLNARYYDPEVGRFINADESLDGGYNLFSYCYNSPITFEDKFGEDAIWLHDKNAVYGAGHTGLLIQDAQGTWYHFYWGNSGNGKFGKKGVGQNQKMLEPLDKHLPRGELVNYSRKYYNGIYTDYIYFEGDFSKGFDFLKKQQGTNYNLICKNCVEVSVTALLLGKFKSRIKEKIYKPRLRKALVSIVPNRALQIVRKGYC